MNEITTKPDGIYPDMPDAEYRALPRLSNSLIKYGMIDHGYTMAHMKAAVDGLMQRDTPELAFGRAFHVRVLEPKKYRESYAIMPKFDRRTKDGKAGEAEWYQANPGKSAITQEDADTLEAMAQSIKSHHEARRRVSCAGGCEVSVLWTDDATGLPLRCRMDKWIDLAKPTVIVDLKGMRSLATHNLQSDIYKYGYHVQAALYSDAIKKITGKWPRFYFLFVEKTYPYAVRLAGLDADAIKIGRATYRQVLIQYKKCLETGVFPAWESVVETIELSSWVVKQSELMMEASDGE